MFYSTTVNKVWMDGRERKADAPAHFKSTIKYLLKASTCFYFFAILSQLQKATIFQRICLLSFFRDTAFVHRTAD